MRRAIALLLALAAAVPGLARGQDAPGEDDARPDAPAEAGRADVQATESARAHFRLGVDFYRERNFRAALIEFQRAYADAPHYKLLYNLAQASLELQEYAGAIDYFAAYLQQGGDEIAPERRQEVEQAIADLESRIARITVTSDQPGAEIHVDDTLVGRAPLREPVRVGAGRHKFSAVKEGLAPVERILDVAAGDLREVRLEFEAQPGTAAEPVVRTEVVHDESGNTAALWAGMTTAMLGAGAITMTVLATLAQKSYKDELEVQTTKAKLDELRDDAETKALVTDIAWAATIASGVVTAVLIVTGDDSETEASAGRARSGVALGVGPGGVVIDGRF